MHLAVIIMLTGVVDQIQNHVALIEWSNGQWSELSIEQWPIPLSEGSQLRIETTDSKLTEPTLSPKIQPSITPVTRHLLEQEYHHPN